MPITLDWIEITLRLVLTLLAGGLLGLNRTERGMTAGLRTTLLVTLAASVSMIQVNLLLGTAGRPPDSLVMLDLMRLPLGVLTGMGFIGAGAILRRGDRVNGVTTAATLWLATVLGLCFGGGQHSLGLVALGIGLLTLWTLKHFEISLPQERRGTLAVRIGSDGPTDEEVRALVEQCGASVSDWDVSYRRDGAVLLRTISCLVCRRQRATERTVPDFVRQLVERSGVLAVRWRE